MRLALVITTYERPDALAAVLDSVARQSRRTRRSRRSPTMAREPRPASWSAAFIARSRGAGAPRVASRTKASASRACATSRSRATNADYLVFIDGDMLLHPAFHRRPRAAGARAASSRRACACMPTRALTRALHRRSRAPAAARGRPVSAACAAPIYCTRRPLRVAGAPRSRNGIHRHQGLQPGLLARRPRRVNGFNEAIEGWGPEDKELAARLANAGVRRQTLLFGGIAVPPAPCAGIARRAARESRGAAETTRRERRTRCELGLDAHFAQLSG